MLKLLFHSLLLVSVGLLASPAAWAQTPLTGNYTINSAQPTGGTNFASFSAAAASLTANGISGPVTISVSGGPYTEQFVLGEIAGTSATSRLTINGNGRTLRFEGTATSYGVVVLNGTDYTTLDNLVVEAPNDRSSYEAVNSFGIMLTNAANNDRLTNNVIRAAPAGITGAAVGIVTSGSLNNFTVPGVSANNLLIEGNTITGGGHSIALYGNTAAAPSTGNIVRNNIIQDFYLAGVYLGNQDGTQIIGNDLSRPTRRPIGDFNGIWAYTNARGLTIEKNRFHDPCTGDRTNNVSPTRTSARAIYLETGTYATAAKPNDVVNNVVYNMNSIDVQAGVYSTGDYVRVYNNSVSFDDSALSLGTLYGIYCTGANCEVLNNIISISMSGFSPISSLYYGSSLPVSDYNVVPLRSYAVSVNTFPITRYTTLAAWQAANGGAYDQHSLATDAIFTKRYPSTVGIARLIPLNPALNNIGQALARVTDDITGATRSANPDPGAFEFTPVATDLTPTALPTLFNSISTRTCYDSPLPMSVQVRNNGTAALNFATNAATVTVTVTRPDGTTTTLTGTLATGTLAAAAEQAISLPGTLDLTTASRYSFAVTATVQGDQNPGNDALTPAPALTVADPVAGTLTMASNVSCQSNSVKLSFSGAANGDIKWQSSTDGVTFTDLVDLTGLTGTGYTTPTLTSTTYYRVQVRCGTRTATSNTSVVVIGPPQVTGTNGPVTVCAGATATLTATPSVGAAIRFFSTATGGTALASTAPGIYTTPALSAGTTYYAEAYAKPLITIGKGQSSMVDGTDRSGGLYFTATGPATIANVLVYCPSYSAAGTATIYLLPGSYLAPGNTTSLANALTSVTVPLPANPTGVPAPAVLPLNFAVPAAGAYTLYLGATTRSLMRDGASSVPLTAFPYTASGSPVTITGSTQGSNYCFFYNWQVSPDNECVNSARTAIQVNVGPSCGTAPALTASPQPSGAVLLTTAVVAGATYQFFLNGVPVGPPSSNNTLLLLGGAQSGVYTVVVISATGYSSLTSNPVSTTVLGTSAALAGSSLHVYPNPTADGLLSLSLTTPHATVAHLTVLDALGRVVRTMPLPTGTSSLSLASLAPGLYVLQVHMPEGVITQRVVRQ